MRIKKYSLLLLLINLFCCGVGYAAGAYQEKVIPQGKAIFGLSEEEALNKYGVPTSINEKLWYYNGSEKLYIYLEKPLAVYLYPPFYKGVVGAPIELKILSGSPEIADVTLKSELVISDPSGFNIAGQAVLVPKKPGDYQVIASYKSIYSNASFISIVESKNEAVEGEQLLSIDIFPYKPYVNPNTEVYFSAFGTFVSKGRYTVREITRQAEWFTERNDVTQKLENSKVALVIPGKSQVFCKYKGLQSIPQDVEVAKSAVRLDRYLKQISVVPANVSVGLQASMPFHAFATYGDNSVEEVTKKTGWVINDRAILERESDNIFVAKLVGVTEVQGVLEDLRSLPAKVAVSSSPVNPNPSITKSNTDNIVRKRRKNLGAMLEGIQGDIKGLNKKVTEEEKLKYIRIIPDVCDISVGIPKQIYAYGVWQDNTEEDITILATWEILNNKIATVYSGLVNPVTPGKTQVCLRYKNIGNQCIPVTVSEAKLISIAVEPSELEVVKGERVSLKAEGYFGDSSHRDITLLANWASDNLDIVKMDKNNVLPVRIGKTQVYAEHSGVRSLPVQLEVVKEKYWLLKLILKVIFFLFLILLILYAYFRILTERAKKHILSLYVSPRDFVIALYKNLNKVMAILGMPQKFYIPPLFFAGLVEEKYAMGDNLFLRFTELFEEAKYSSHLFPSETSRLALDAYNDILKVVFAQHNKRVSAYKSLIAIIKKTPIFISKIQTS